MARGNPNFSKSGGEHPSAKKVDQYTVDGVFIKTFGSVKDAAEAVGLRYQSIINAIKHNTVSAHYLWKYSTN